MSLEPDRGLAGRRGWIVVVVASLLGTHVVLLGWAAAKSSPTLNGRPTWPPACTSGSSGGSSCTGSIRRW